MVMITLIAETQDVKVYQHNTIDGRISVYQLNNGELIFGAEKASVLNRFEQTQVYETICRVLTHKI